MALALDVTADWLLWGRAVVLSDNGPSLKRDARRWLVEVEYLPGSWKPWKKLPKRGFVLTGPDMRYRFCSLKCLEQALVAGLGKRWPSPSGKRSFEKRYEAGYLKRVCAWPSQKWPRKYESALEAIAELRDTIKPGQLDAVLAVAAEIRRAARKLAPPRPPEHSRYRRYGR